MKFFLVTPSKQRLAGQIALSGDKSIACRSIIISAISKGKTVIENFPLSKDCFYTIKVFQGLGIRILQHPSREYPGAKRVTVFGRGLYGLREPKGPIFAGDSGTTLRLGLGVLAGQNQNFTVTLRAGKSLSQRPMLRVTAPLRKMGAEISARKASNPQFQTPNSKLEEYPPITIKGANLKAITYKMPIPSAQVKSAILLAGLYAKGTTCLLEEVKTRDHTERMLRLFKAKIKLKQKEILIKGNKELFSPGSIFIPGDISSASFFMVLAAILPDSEILIKNVSLNPSRAGIIRVLKRMGADIKVGSRELGVGSWEPIGDLTVKSSKLKGRVIKKEEIPSLIDELPILMVAACFAKGRSILEGVGELRVKETDRIKSMSENLRKMGADIKVIKRAGIEKIVIHGPRKLKGASVKSFGDHRTAMSMVVAGLSARGKTRIDDITCINKSFPNFLHLLRALIP